MPSDTDPLGKTDEIRLSRATVAVPWEQRKELMDRLDAAGHVEAAKGLRTRRAFTEEQKPRVFEVLNEWLHEVKVDAFGEHLMDLREELDGDMNRP